MRGTTVAKTCCTHSSQSHGAEDYETVKALSAINLMYEKLETGAIHSVESWFQAAKVYGRDGHEYGPYPGLLTVKVPKRYLNPHLDSKTVAQYENDEPIRRIQSEILGADLVRFELWGEPFQLIPRSCFHDYLYAKTLYQQRNDELAARLCDYRVFTDIMFNPDKGKRRKFNAQVRRCAVFVGLTKRSLLDIAISDIDSFIDVVGYAETPMSPVGIVEDSQLNS